MTDYEIQQFEGRSDRGLVVTLSQDTKGRTTLIFDDACRQSRVGDGAGWESQAFYTKVEFSTDQLEKLQVSNKDLARIGENIVIRLLALNNV
ncbi:MAG: hypothetical protein ACE5FV_07340 [Woeseia sp.]